MDTYISNDRYLRLVEALAAIEPCAITGKGEPDQMVQALMAARIWPASVRPKCHTPTDAADDGGNDPAVNALDGQKGKDSVIDAVRQSMDDLAVKLRSHQGSHSAHASLVDQLLGRQFLATLIETSRFGEREARNYHAFRSDPRTSPQTEEATGEAIDQLGPQWS